jgi:hypothetical protein
MIFLITGVSAPAAPIMPSIGCKNAAGGLAQQSGEGKALQERNRQPVHVHPLVMLNR